MGYSFLDFDSVRAVLGASTKELPDTTLETPIFALRLAQDCTSISADLLSDYAVARSLSTTAAINFVRAFDIFAVFSMAKACLASLPQFSPKSVTDGKAGFSRYSDSPYKAVQDKIGSEYELYRENLLSAYGGYGGGTSAASDTVATLFVATSPNYDPITGE